MMIDEARVERLETAEAQEVSVPALLEKELTQAATDAAWYVERQERNQEVHYCWWEGQSLDGRKHLEDLGADPFPWEGASDTRVRLAEDLINDEARLLEAAWRSAQIKLVPVEKADQQKSARGMKVLRWELKRGLSTEARVEGELARQWRQAHGAALMRVTWREELTTDLQSVNIDQVMQAIQAGDGNGTAPVADVAAAEDVVYHPGRTEELLKVLARLLPGARAKDLRRAAKQLRATGVAVEIPVPIVLEARPCWRALRIFEDVFFPPECDDLQKAPWIQVREFLTEAQVRERELYEDWTPGFADKLLEQPGPSEMGVAWENVTHRLRRPESQERLSTDAKSRFELWTAYRRAVDERGVPGVWVTVWSSKVRDEKSTERGPMPARKEVLLDYTHKQVCFVALVRERKERAILESRGIPEVVMTWQSELKVQRDAQADLASVEVMPPMEAPQSAARQKLSFGPKSVNYTRTPGSFKPINIGGRTATSEKVQLQLEKAINDFFCRGAEVPPARLLRYAQSLVSGYLGEMREVLLQTFQLSQQFREPAELARILGVDTPEQATIHDGAVDIRGQFDIELAADARDLDPEMLKLKMETMNTTILPADVTGVVERAGWTRWQMYALDAAMADELVQPVEKVTQQEINDEKQNLALIWSGQEPTMKESGENAQLRLQVIQQQLQANPQWAQRYQQAEGNQDLFRQLLDARVQHFQHILEQRQNAQIGRLGVAPVMGGY
jgi:hypothetical protein